MNEANLLTEWARLLVGSLAAAGVRDVVVSPGSRSTPLVYALHGQPELRCWDVIDERAAAFFALGQARVTGRASLLVCTSGTAGAHYLPAIIEAGLSHLPLLVLTADRPFELQHCSAAQTIDQVKLFGDHVLGFFELGMPEGGSLSLRALRRIAAQAVLTTTWPTPGAVHLNARARKPLEPQAVHTQEEAALRAQIDGLLQAPLVRAYAPRAVPDPAGVEAVARLCRSVERGVISCGPAPLSHRALRDDLGALAQATGFPLLGDATSQARFGRASAVPHCDAFDALLRCPGGLGAEDLQLVVQVGTPSIASGVEQLLLARPELPRVVLSAHAFADPASSAQMLLLGEIGLSVRALVTALGTTIADPSAKAAGPWATRVQRLDELAWQVLEAQLAGAAPAGFSEAEAVRATVSELVPGSVLMLGNSLPIREVDAQCPADLAQVDVLCQRGASGIEGLLAGAAGAATGLDRPLTLLIGDVSALHDLAALPLLLHARVPVTVVVLQNYGGRIFEQLPLARSPAAHADPTLLAHFTTPHALNLEPAARLYGIPYVAVHDVAALRATLRQSQQPAATAAPQVTLIEAVVPPTSAAEHQRAYFAALGAALTRYRETSR